MLKAIKIILNFYIFPGSSGVLYLSMLKYYYSKYSSKKKENSSGKYFQIKFPCYIEIVQWVTLAKKCTTGSCLTFLCLKRFASKPLTVSTLLSVFHFLK